MSATHILLLAHRDSCKQNNTLKPKEYSYFNKLHTVSIVLIRVIISSDEPDLGLFFTVVKPDDSQTPIHPPSQSYLDKL